MTEYTVRWEIQVSADNGQEATEIARAMQLDPFAFVNHFKVIDKDGVVVLIDLPEDII